MEEKYVTMEKELDEPYILQYDGKELCIYLDITTEYCVTIDRDIESDILFSSNITEEGVLYEVYGCCDNDSGIEIPFEDVLAQLSEEKKELLDNCLQDYAERNSGFSDDDIFDKALYQE